jgi:predicted metal-dependent phosphoesterase TrpH
MIAKLHARGCPLPADRVDRVEAASVSLGRRHVAALLVAGGFARDRRDAFLRIMGPIAGEIIPKYFLPLEDAIALVHAAGGVCSLAHPPAGLTDAEFRELAIAGLDALEVEYPWNRRSYANRLREVAARHGFAVTGGSDCHGREPRRCAVGSRAIGLSELDALRRLSGQAGCPNPRN